MRGTVPRVNSWVAASARESERWWVRRVAWVALPGGFRRQLDGSLAGGGERESGSRSLPIPAET